MDYLSEGVSAVVRPRFVVLPLLALVAGAALASEQEYFPPSFPKVVVSRPSETQVVVYDARPELGIGMHDMAKPARDMVSKLGIRLVRHTMYWNLMETTDKPGVYDQEYLSEWDRLVEECRAEGVCLEVVVHGDPPGISFADRKAAYERFARFIADMARRYPSVIYWELMNEMDSGFTCLFGAKDNVAMRERGKMYAEFLKIAYPAVRAANPAAWVLTGGMSDTDEFPRGIYEGGGRGYFDIMNIHTYGVPVVTAFVERAKGVREIMKENVDGDKPLWNTEFGLDAGNVVGAWGYPHAWNPAQDDGKAFDQKQLDDYRNCLRKNTELGLYQKLLPYQFQAGNERDDDGLIKTKAQLPEGMTIDDFGFGIVRRDMSPRPTYRWLQESQLNQTISNRPRFFTNVFVPTKRPMMPVGYDYREVDGGIQIQRVLVDSLVPTRIDLRFAPEKSQPKPEPGKPAAPGTPAKPERATPLPDPFDI